MKLLRGKEALCKVQLTHTVDGDILAVSMSHMLTDGMHWPQFLTHLAARYKELVTEGGYTAAPSALIAWDGNKGDVTYERVKESFVRRGLVEETWTPKTVRVKAGLMDHARAWTLLFKNGWQKVNFEIVGVSNARIQSLKAAVMGQVRELMQASEYPEGTYVGTGDVVQALAMMMVLGAEKKPMFPIAPASNLVLAQIPEVSTGGATKYFGNSVHVIRVNFDAGSVDEKGMSSLEILTRLAVRIRQCTLAFRGDPSEALQGLYETEAISNQPILKALGFLAGKRFPYVNCTTNYIGPLKEDAELSFTDQGTLVPEAVQWLVTPLARDMCVVRPHKDSMLFMMGLPPSHVERMRALNVWNELVDDAIFY